MTLIAVKEAVLRELKNQIDSRYETISRPKVTDRLDEDLGLDSLDRVEIWTAMEQKYKIDIPEEEVVEAKTVADVIELIYKRVEKENEV